jgi:hypothetical protein
MQAMKIKKLRRTRIAGAEIAPASFLFPLDRMGAPPIRILCWLQRFRFRSLQNAECQLLFPLRVPSK